jgi:hypothetical protein
MNSLLDRLRRFLSNAPDVPIEDSGHEIDSVDGVGAEPAVTLDDSALSCILAQIEQTKVGEYRCPETLDLLDEYAELVVGERDAAKLMPLVKSHIEHCADCSERYEALLRILEDS